MKQVIFHSYDIIKEIAGGGMGLLYHVREKSTNLEFAIKKLNAEALKDPISKKGFLDEAILMTRLEDHPNIVKLHKVTADDQYFYLVMEYVPGEDLKKFLSQTGPLSFTQALPIILQVAEALDYMHRFSIIHRDIKPANILINQQDASTVKVTDFGIAKDLDKYFKTYTTAGYGTLPYISPEQLRDSERIHQREQSEESIGPTSDLYSLGIVFFEMLTGTTPFHQMANKEIYSRKESGQPPLTLLFPSSVPSEGRKIIQSLVEWNPKDRIQDARLLIKRLETLNPASDNTRPIPDSDRTTPVLPPSVPPTLQDSSGPVLATLSEIPGNRQTQSRIPQDPHTFEPKKSIFTGLVPKWIGMAAILIAIVVGGWYSWTFFVTPVPPPLLHTIEGIVVSTEIESKQLNEKRHLLKDSLEEIHTKLQASEETPSKPGKLEELQKSYQRWKDSLNELLGQQHQSIDNLDRRLAEGLGQIAQANTQDWTSQDRSRLEDLKDRLTKHQSTLKAQLEKDKQAFSAAEQIIQKRLKDRPPGAKDSQQTQNRLTRLQKEMTTLKKRFAQTEQKIIQNTSAFMENVYGDGSMGYPMIQQWQDHRKTAKTQFQTMAKNWNGLSTTWKTALKEMGSILSGYPEGSQKEKLKSHFTKIKKQHADLAMRWKDFSWKTDTQLSLSEAEIFGCHFEQWQTVVAKNQRALIEKSMASLTQSAILAPQVATELQTLFSLWAFVDVAAHRTAEEKGGPTTIRFDLKEAGVQAPRKEHFLAIIPQRQGMWCLAQW